jgi:dCTP deaminase
LGSNSYDVHLGAVLATYTDAVLDCKVAPTTQYHTIPVEGFVLHPGQLYLAVTEEYTETYKAVPFLDGKSSVGRLGIAIHVTAGRGDSNFCGHWTLEIFVIRPVRVYAGMLIGQLIYFRSSAPDIPYDQKLSAKYSNHTAVPLPSRMHLNFETPSPILPSESARQPLELAAHHTALLSAFK